MKKILQYAILFGHPGGKMSCLIGCHLRIAITMEKRLTENLEYTVS